MHKDLQRYCGIDLTQLFSEFIEEGKDCVLACWLRNAMGLKSSPYNCVQGALRAKQIVKGNRRDPKNTFQWDHIAENLPCSKTYNASKPLLSKLRKDGEIASDIVQYVDDARTLASSEERSWQAQSKMAKTLSYLGLQDAARKCRMGGQCPGA